MMCYPVVERPRTIVIQKIKPLLDSWNGFMGSTGFKYVAQIADALDFLEQILYVSLKKYLEEFLDEFQT